MILEKNNFIILGPMLDDAVSLARGRADNLGQRTHYRYFSVFLRSLIPTSKRESKRKIYTYRTNGALREHIVHGTKRLGRHLRGNRADREVMSNPSLHISDANLTLRTACVGELLKCDRVI